MKFPIRPFSMLVIGLLTVAACHAAQAAKLPPSSGGSQAAAIGGEPSSGQQIETVIIPGPLRSFLRMAGISQEATPGEVLPLLARNAFLYGHTGGKPTEYLVLADRYVHLARELQALAGADGTIHVSGCADAGKLIQILGYKFERGCSPKDASLITVDAERAFLTVDSGFPLTQLEEALQKGTPFAYAFPATRVPILLSEKDWIALVPAKERPEATLLGLLMNDQNADRLYSAMARLDPGTRLALFQSPGLRRLLGYAPLLDFYGSRICIRSGAVAVPGGDAAEQSWRGLAGASPKTPGDFVYHLLAKDQGWLAAYFDALSRVRPAQQARLAEGDRLKRLYEAYHSGIPGFGAGSGVFPRNSDLLLLFTGLRWDAKGEPVVPANLGLWREIFARGDKASHLHASSKFLHGANSPDAVLDALAAYSNVVNDSGPLQAYLALNAIDSAKAPESLSDATARLLAGNLSQYGDWYPTFVEFPALDDASITQFVNTAKRIDDIANPALRSNVLGAFQAEIGIWQILARQRQIPENALNPSWINAVQPFAGASSSIQLFDAARSSLQSILVAAGGIANFTQDEVVDLLAGPAPSSPEAAQVRQEIARRMRAVLDDQRLVSLDALFGLYDGLGEMAHGAAIGSSLLPLAGALREFEMPRPIFTSGERASWSPLVYTSRHAELQVRTDLTAVIRGPGTPAQLEAARARLAPFFRDTLVGLIYAYYEPPGAQVLHNNPLFVRSHDFAASSIQGIQNVWDAPALVGIGATAGGGAYLIGSLADLPYVLALTEEDFIVPRKTQALTWRETVPELLVDAVVPRWWTVSRDELHAVSLYQRAGEELLAASPANADLREGVIAILSDRMDWGRMEVLKQDLESPKNTAALRARMLPADTFYLAVEFRKRFPDQAAHWGPACQELDDLARKNPSDTDPQRISSHFGVPHPTLAESASPALLTTEPLPVSGGSTSRLFSESWESNNLYWARLADEKGVAPSMLNVLIPELTRQMIANISATSIDDWPALLRAMDETGEQFRQGRIDIHILSSAVNNQEIANGGANRDE
jgi:hypothetical protein